MQEAEVGSTHARSRGGQRPCKKQRWATSQSDGQQNHKMAMPHCFPLAVGEANCCPQALPATKQAINTKGSHKPETRSTLPSSLLLTQSL